MCGGGGVEEGGAQEARREVDTGEKRGSAMGNLLSSQSLEPDVSRNTAVRGTQSDVRKSVRTDNSAAHVGIQLTFCITFLQARKQGRLPGNPYSGRRFRG